MPAILIVDDDAVTTDYFTRALRAEGYDVLPASGADDAIQQVSRVRPDAMLIDLRMPVVDGAVLLRRLRQLDGLGDVPAAIVTGDYLLSDQDVNRLRLLGAEVRFKPLWIDDLADIVRGLLDRGRTPPAGHPAATLHA